MKHLLYADDTQVYISLTSENASSAIHELQQCLKSVQNWMAANKLKLNPDKTEFILFGHKLQREKLADIFPVDILGNQLTPTDSVRNLGIIFDSDFTFRKHVSSVVSSGFYYIRDLCRIRKHLPKAAAVTLANALVSSRLDYCNSLFYGISSGQLRRLQSVQNTLCRIVTGTSRYASVTPALMKLHWLPVRYRIIFKTNLITYKCLGEQTPVYLSQYLTPFSSLKNTRRSDPSKLVLNVPYYDYKIHKSFIQLKSSYAYSGPRLWNELPLDVRAATSTGSFRKRLKAYLYDLAFPP